jgi:hypothetical protein
MSDENPVGSYSPGVSVKKAGFQTLQSYGAAVATALMALLASPDLMAQLMGLVGDYPKVSSALVAFFGFARFGFALWRDYQKHKQPAYHLEHGVTPAKAEQLAVASGADPAKAEIDTKVAAFEQKAKKDE